MIVDTEKCCRFVGKIIVLWHSHVKPEGNQVDLICRLSGSNYLTLSAQIISKCTSLGIITIIICLSVCKTCLLI